MKLQRFFHIFIALLLLAVFLTPQSAQASAFLPAKEGAKTTTATLTVYNYTGGTLYARMQGINSYNYYSFSTSKSGKTRFENIIPGKYTITLTTSACNGQIVLKNREVKKNLNTKAVYCRHK